MKSLRIIAATLLLSLCSGVSMAQVRVIELGHEVSPDSLTLPQHADGELAIHGCATCKVLRLRASPKSLYIIGDQQVTLAEMTKYLELNKRSTLVVMQRKDTFDLSRVLVKLPKRAK